jgi:small-conductance mechanosensitive channel
VLLLALDNLGINITAFVAGLGIGGIAVALATQKILGDIFASLSIVLDKPFVLGDFIVVQDHMGTVEHIGLKTTRLRSLTGEQLIISNSDLLDSRIQNFKRMQERRVLFTINVPYETSHEKVAKVSGILKNVVENRKEIRFDRAHLKQFTPSGIEFEVVYYVLQAEFNVYMDIQQEMNLELFKRFESEGIEFARPAQQLQLHLQNGKDQAAVVGSKD